MNRNLMGMQLEVLKSLFLERERELVNKSTNSKKDLDFFQKLWVGLVALKFH